MRRVAPLMVVLLLAACGEDGGKPAAGPAAATPAVVTATATPIRVTDAGQLTRGAKIYKANCAVCHGANAEGAPNWHRQGPDGKYPAPPLNGTGHDWHHPTSALKWTIREGTAKLGGNMPAWKDKLPDSDIEAVIAWFQSLWPEEVYKNWVLIDARSGAGMRR